MAQNRSPSTIAALERQILRALCAGVSNAADWDRLASGLSAHHWQDPDHKVLYQALRAIKSRDPKTLREELPAQVTRMGFPDMDWSLYFDAIELPTPEIEGLIRRLQQETDERS